MSFIVIIAIVLALSALAVCNAAELFFLLDIVCLTLKKLGILKAYNPWHPLFNGSLKAAPLEGLVGSRAIVKVAFRKSDKSALEGKVLCKGTLWTARSNQLDVEQVALGDSVVVSAVDGLVLIVERISKAEPQQSEVR